MHSVLTEEDRKEFTLMKKKKMKRKIKKDEKQITEWVLCLEDLRGIVITYVPQFNTIPIEDNYAEISQEIKKAYKQYQRNTQMKKVK